MFNLLWIVLHFLLFDFYDRYPAKTPLCFFPQKLLHREFFFVLRVQGGSRKAIAQRKGVRIKSAENLGPTYRTRVETLVIRHVKPKDPFMKGNS
jgi:hypothetical protein